jgi:D-3-phosphoglycerate dehydrogenase
LEAIPEGHLLFIYNQDIPGAIGQITTLLGKEGINIDRMHVSQDQDKKQNAILLATNPEADSRVLGELRSLSCVLLVRKLEL